MKKWRKKIRTILIRHHFIAVQIQIFYVNIPNATFYIITLLQIIQNRTNFVNGCLLHSPHLIEVSKDFHNHAFWSQFFWLLLSDC